MAAPLVATAPLVVQPRTEAAGSAGAPPSPTAGKAASVGGGTLDAGEATGRKMAAAAAAASGPRAQSAELSLEYPSLPPSSPKGNIRGRDCCCLTSRTCGKALAALLFLVALATATVAVAALFAVTIPFSGFAFVAAFLGGSTYAIAAYGGAAAASIALAGALLCCCKRPEENAFQRRMNGSTDGGFRTADGV